VGEPPLLLFETSLDDAIVQVQDLAVNAFVEHVAGEQEQAVRRINGISKSFCRRLIIKRFIGVGRIDQKDPLDRPAGEIRFRAASISRDAGASWLMDPSASTFKSDSLIKILLDMYKLFLNRK
jgi:hypothetical protein